MRSGIQLSATRVEARAENRRSSGRQPGGPNCHWTADLDRLLREAWNVGGAAVAFATITEVRPEWSRFAVQRRARKLGLEPTSRPWSADERNLLLHAIGGANSVPAVAVMLKRSESSVRSKLRQLNYSVDDFDGYRPKDVAHWLDVPVRQVRYWVERGYLQTHNHRITEASLSTFVRERSGAIPFQRLSRQMQRWLLELGYPERDLNEVRDEERSTRRKPASTVRTPEPGTA